MEPCVELKYERKADICKGMILSKLTYQKSTPFFTMDGHGYGFCSRIVDTAPEGLFGFFEVLEGKEE